MTPITVAPTNDSNDALSAISSQQPVKSLPSTFGQTERAPVTVESPLMLVVDNDDDEEPMPTIDMESDSDG